MASEKVNPNHEPAFFSAWELNSYYGESYIVQSVSLNVHEGEILALLGRNGAGKTSTLRTIARLAEPMLTRGEIWLDHQPIHTMASHEASKCGIQLVPEDRRIIQGLTVEENIKLAQIVPALSARSGSHVSRSPGDCDLHLHIEKHTKYTCELRLTYLFDDEGGLVADPDLVVRVYYDARMAEVRSCINQHRHAMLNVLSEECGRELDQRWSRNIMLSKWLDYLYEQRHIFPAI